MKRGFEATEVIAGLLAVSLFILVMILGVMCIMAVNLASTERVDEVARCESLDGEYGGGKCYVNGEER